jgi:biopolymer transport protein ExbB
MNLVEWLKGLMVGFGAGWVLWLLVVLSVVSIAIILERAWFFFSLRDDLVVLAREFRTALEESPDAARKRLDRSPSAEAAVVAAGLAVAHRGPESAQEAMAGAAALQRMKLEKRLAYLATLGNNAPFIGLFGTVIGVVAAFEALGQSSKVTVAEAASQALAPAAVMSNIAEALVATAVGILVAIPAVAANNYFQRSTKSILANTEALSRVLLSHLRAKTDPNGDAGDPSSKPTPAPSASASSGDKSRAQDRATERRGDKARRGSAKDADERRGSRGTPPGGGDDQEDEPKQDG